MSAPVSQQEYVIEWLSVREVLVTTRMGRIVRYLIPHVTRSGVQPVER